MEAQRRDTQVINRAGLLQLGQNQPKAVGVLRLDARLIAGEEELLQPFVGKALDHGGYCNPILPKLQLIGLRTASREFPVIGPRSSVWMPNDRCKLRPRLRDIRVHLLARRGRQVQVRLGKTQAPDPQNDERRP